MVTHSSVLAWRIPGTGEPGVLPSMGSHRVGHNWSNLAAAAAFKYKWQIWKEEEKEEEKEKLEERMEERKVGREWDGEEK